MNQDGRTRFVVALVVTALIVAALIIAARGLP